MRGVLGILLIGGGVLLFVVVFRDIGTLARGENVPSIALTGQVANPNQPIGSNIPLPFTGSPVQSIASTGKIANPNQPSGSNIPLPFTGQP